jgi:EmrB/QacA subfamily drug resistance transporter
MKDSVQRRVVTLALLLAMAVAALEQTVVSTAMPSIIAALKGVDIYPWVISAYLLASTVSMPLYGKMADLLGRRRVLLFGLALFGLGSILSGLATSMPLLIGMRVIQGLGAGAIGPIVLTMLGDLFTMEERARVQGLFSGVWGVSSLAGPALGGVLTDRLSWRWVFFVTVPFGVLAAWILVAFVREKEMLEPPDRRATDWWGAILLAAGSSALLLAVLGGAGRSVWWTMGLTALGLVLIALLVRQEHRAADPILPLDLLTHRVVAPAVVGSVVVGCVLFGLDTYVPLFVQGVLGGTASQAGWTMTPLFLAWSVSVAVAAAVVTRLGFRMTAVIGSILIAAGSLGMVVGAQELYHSQAVLIVSMVVVGLGMGPTALSYILGVQNSVDWGQRGVATAAVTFFRSMGGALGVGFLGATLGFEVSRRLFAASARGIDVAAALRPETHQFLTTAQLEIVQSSLRISLRDVFLQILALAAAGIVCSLWIPRGPVSRKADDAASALSRNTLQNAFIET